MTASEVEYYLNDDAYLEWLAGLVAIDGTVTTNEFHLLLTLYSIPYDFAYEKDENRMIDIDELRERFEESYQSSHLPFAAPSVLEMMIALSLKIENKVMSNLERGNRAPKWFWMMLDNLGLTYDTTGIFSEEYVTAVINRWITHQFEPNGDGSPFPMRRPPADLTKVDIWRHCMWYMNEKYAGEW